MSKEKFSCEMCDEIITEKESKYSIKNYKKSLCREHQKNPIEKKVIKKELKVKTEEKKKPISRSENMIKGRLGEALIEGLFLDLGFNVFRYGMENTIPGIMKLLSGVRGDVSTNIRKMPDFVIQHPENKKVYFIEVKFRANETLKLSDLGKDYPYENCYFVLVSKKHIKCLNYGELSDLKEFTPESKPNYYLGDRKEFINKKEDKDKIIEYCDFAKKFFANV
jgi:hypothetical protein